MQWNHTFVFFFFFKPPTYFNNLQQNQNEGEREREKEANGKRRVKAGGEMLGGVSRWFHKILKSMGENRN